MKSFRVETLCVLVVVLSSTSCAGGPGPGPGDEVRDASVDAAAIDLSVLVDAPLDAQPLDAPSLDAPSLDANVDAGTCAPEDWWYPVCFCAPGECLVELLFDSACGECLSPWPDGEACCRNDGSHWTTGRCDESGFTPDVDGECSADQRCRASSGPDGAECL